MEPRSKKRKCLTANWLDLPQELLPSIARRICSVQDFVTFGAVCKTWSRASTKENFLGGLTHEVPFLVLPDYSSENEEKADYTTPKLKYCYNLTKGKFCRLNLNVPKTPIELHRLLMWSSCRSSLGWLIIRPQTRNLRNDVYLLHPFKDTKIVLPTYRERIKKIVLSSSPSLTSDYIAMVSYTWSKELAFWRPKDKEWTKISLPRYAWSKTIECFDDIAYYRGKFHVVDRSGNVLVCDIDDHKAEARVVPKMPLYLFHDKNMKQLYLVESAGDLLVVVRVCLYAKTVGFRVFKVTFNTDNWTEVKNLGNRVLFLGDNSSSFSIETSDYSRCKANCIYFTTDQMATQQCGVFSMKDRKVKPLLQKFPSFLKPYSAEFLRSFPSLIATINQTA